MWRKKKKLQLTMAVQIVVAINDDAHIEERVNEQKCFLMFLFGGCTAINNEIYYWTNLNCWKSFLFKACFILVLKIMLEILYIEM